MCDEAFETVELEKSALESMEEKEVNWVFSHNLRKRDIHRDQLVVRAL